MRFGSRSVPTSTPATRPFLPSMGVTVTTWPSTLEELARVLLAVERGVHQRLEAGDAACVEPSAFGEALHLGDGDQQAASVVDHEEAPWSAV